MRISPASVTRNGVAPTAPSATAADETRPSTTSATTQTDASA